ncbi:hypothetical protein GCM10010156_47220 [Planobispora rosea]|uniref:Polysaccharide chain length determinant N-terminal domain-containing protein n=1 Tax=Planobispora rosea TaxID=35762 RepID=A0A8J3S620_PLARO|nr:hypothetical protein [Planobispora rosea]GGS83101.1 hypothetical protein GCM10010156_47220 [Planobispora rosea]GIH84163.1 hypothetical protein Pro02_25710 [Planobispora rosea]
MWRYRWSSLVLILLAGALAAAASLFLLTGVTATARFAVTDPRSTTFLRQGVSSDSSYIAYTAQRAAFAESAGVLDKARQLLATEQSIQVKLEELREAVEVKAGTGGGIIEVTATARTDMKAAQIANAVVAAYQILTEADAQREQDKLLKSVRSTRIRIQSEMKRVPPGGATATSLAEALVQLQLKESDAAIDLAQYSSGVRFVDQANPLRITPTQLPKNVAIGLAVGVMIATVISFLRATNPIAGVQRVTTGAGQRAARRNTLPVRLSRSPAPRPEFRPSPKPDPEHDPEHDHDHDPEQPVRSAQPTRSAQSAQSARSAHSDDSIDDSTVVYDKDELLSYTPAPAKPLDNEAVVIVESSAGRPKNAG